MKFRTIILLFLVCCKLSALSSSDDYIIQSSGYISGNARTKIYLGQIWGTFEVKDNLIKTESFEVLGDGYKDVIIYDYENIEITTAQFFPNIPVRVVVVIRIKGNKFCTWNNITIGGSIDDVTSIYGQPDYKLNSDGLIYLVYRINDPHSAYQHNLMQYSINFIHENNIVKEITVHYVINI
jgi:hypothetical protein